MTCCRVMPNICAMRKSATGINRFGRWIVDVPRFSGDSYDFIETGGSTGALEQETQELIRLHLGITQFHVRRMRNGMRGVRLFRLGSGILASAEACIPSL